MDLVNFGFDDVLNSVSVGIVVSPHAFILLRKHIKSEIAVASINFAGVPFQPVKVQLVTNLHADHILI